MATVFTQIIRGELPARFVWRDEVGHWLDLGEDPMAQRTGVSREIGRAIQKGFEPTRVGLIIAGLEVPHVRIHVLPVDALDDLDFA